MKYLKFQSRILFTVKSEYLYNYFDNKGKI